jgi:hypothetical protein
MSAGAVPAGPAQQVNLYRDRQSAKAAAAGARLLLFAGLAAVISVLLLAVAAEVYKARLENDRAAVAATLREKESALAQVRQQLAAAASEPFLEAELDRLREARDQLALSLNAIARHAAAGREGFSAFFVGLARNTLDGLWFDSVGLSAGGAEMLLKGHAVEPALVPRLLQALAAEQAFRGRAFRKVSFQRRERDEHSTVEFELRSAPAPEVEGAG